MLGTISQFFMSLVGSSNYTLRFNETDYQVSVNEKEISCIAPDGEKQTVFWANLKTVLIKTNSYGPLNTRVYWVLKDNSKHSHCVIPLGAVGETHLLDRLQTLPEFDDGAFIEAMGSNCNRKFVCWQSKPGQLETRGQTQA